MTEKKNTFETIYKMGKFSARNNGTEYEIVYNGDKVVETIRFEHYDEDEVVAFVDKCDNAHRTINDIKRTIDGIILLQSSYHTFKNAVETLEQLDVPQYMSDDVHDLERKLIRMMVWVSTSLTTTETREISMEIVGMMVKDFNEVRETLNKIVAF